MSKAVIFSKRFLSSTVSSPKKLITVFYDGKCGLCSKEINHYKKIAPQGIFNWQDITECDKELKQAGVSYSQGLKLLHSVDRHGQVHVGVDSFILIWNQLSKWNILAKIVALSPIRQIVDFAYRKFAQIRFDKLEHCQLAAKNEKEKK